MRYHFVYADKTKLQEILPDCFKILHSNMSFIAPTGNSYEEDFEIWYSAVFPAMQKVPRQIVLMYYNDMLVGYFQYYVSKSSIMMEEIQIKTEHQGRGLFRKFYVWLLNELNDDIEFAEAYAHKRNVKSQSILKYLGLEMCEDKANDRHFYFKGKYSDLRKVIFKTQ